MPRFAVHSRRALAALAVLVLVVVAAGRAAGSPRIACWSGTNSKNVIPSLVVTFRGEPTAATVVEMTGSNLTPVGRGSVRAEARVAQATANCSGRDVILSVDDIERDTLVVIFGGFARVQIKTPERDLLLPARDSVGVDGVHRCIVDAARRGGVQCAVVRR